MSELDKILEKISGQLTDISESIKGLNDSLKQTRSDLIEQLKAECQKMEA